MITAVSTEPIITVITKDVALVYYVDSTLTFFDANGVEFDVTFIDAGSIEYDVTIAEPVRA